LGLVCHITLLDAKADRALVPLHTRFGEPSSIDLPEHASRPNERDALQRSHRQGKEVFPPAAKHAIEMTALDPV
jgi:hypothetical protein